MSGATAPRRILLLIACLAASAGTLLLAGRVYLAAKGQIAAILIERAYAAHLQDGEDHPPWPWADLRPIARLEVARLGIIRTVLAGATGESLAFGLGHVSGTTPPAGEGNCAVAGHRDNWAAFLGDLRIGDELTIETRGDRRMYRVAAIDVVPERDLSPIQVSDSSRLTLITCFPVTGITPSIRRLIVVAEAIDELKGSSTARSIFR